MRERKQATIGDALIFMTKGAGMILACLIILGGIAAGAIWWNSNKSSLANAQRQINALRVQLVALDQALDLEQQRVAEQARTIAASNANVDDLAGRLADMSRFRSEFLARFGQVLGDRPDLRRVGHRIVFQSEVLFPSGSAEIGPSGRGELRKLAQSLGDIVAEMPSDAPWVFQIDGHTDRRPPFGFPSNWELSTARAVNVGKFLVEEGVPPERIAVAGFGEFQPVDNRDDAIAHRRNRRIEIKLTDP